MISLFMRKAAQTLTPCKSHDKVALFAPHWGIIITNHLKWIPWPSQDTKPWHVWQCRIKFLLKLVTRMDMCVHIFVQAHFFLADANPEAGISHAFRDVRLNTTAKQWAGPVLEFVLNTLFWLKNSRLKKSSSTWRQSSRQEEVSSRIVSA